MGMSSTPRFLQGVFPFTGKGLATPIAVDGGLAYTVPGDVRAQLIYLRAGNSSSELINLTLMRDGKPMRLFPVGAKADSHVSLAVVEDLEPDTRLEVVLGAAEGASGSLVLDIGLLEVRG